MMCACLKNSFEKGDSLLITSHRSDVLIYLKFLVLLIDDLAKLKSHTSCGS